MSTIGYTSGQIEHKQHRLDEINRAVLALHADALKLRAAMHVDEEAIERSRRVADAFAQEVEEGLEGRTLDPVVAGLVLRVTASGRPIPDWLHELHALRSAIAHGQPITPDQLAVLVELIRYIDRAFTDDLYRLYGRQ